MQCDGWRDRIPLSETRQDLLRILNQASSAVGFRTGKDLLTAAGIRKDVRMESGKMYWRVANP